MIRLAISGEPRKPRPKWRRDKHMPDENHKPEFPSQLELTTFLKGIGFDGPDALQKASGVPYQTVAKWYRSKPSEMSAVNLIRVVLATKKTREFTLWIQDLEKNTHALVNRGTSARPRASIPAKSPTEAKGARRARE